MAKKIFLIFLVFLLVINTALGIKYTRFNQPIITVPFNENTSITDYSLFDDVTGDSLDVSLFGEFQPYMFEWSFISEEPLEDGTYRLEISFKDLFSNEDSSTIVFVVDTDPPEFEYVYPGEDAVINDNNVPIEIKIDEPGTIQSVMINSEEFGPGFIPDTSEQLFAHTPFLDDGGKLMIINITDRAGNAIKLQRFFIVRVREMNIDIISPSWGVYYEPYFDLRIRASEPTTLCKYHHSLKDFSFPSIESPQNIFTFENENFHNISGFNLTFLNVDANEPYRMYIRCNETSGLISEPAAFDLIWDPSSPIITSARADPAKVIEFLNVTLVVDTDDFTVCKYDNTESSFEAMDSDNADDINDGVFSGYSYESNLNMEFKRVHRKVLTGLEDKRTYAYFVTCMNRAENFSTTQQIVFEVNLLEENRITIKQPSKRYINYTNIELEVETNKAASCTYDLEGETDFDPTGGTTHTTQITGQDGEEYSILIKCRFAAGDKEITVSITVDMSEPSMVTIYDGNYSTSANRLQAYLNATDPESGIAGFEYAIGNATYGTSGWNITQDWTTISSSGAEEVTARNLDLIDGKTYYWTVRAINNVGAKGPISISDGVIINFSGVPVNFTPPIDTCANGIHDFLSESDTDCGQTCPPCADGLKCYQNSDCQNNNCFQLPGFPGAGTCQLIVADHCTNSIFEPNETETDIDCGGDCAGCGFNMTCVVDSDCQSNRCDNETKKCLEGINDADGDGMTDDWENLHGLNPNNPNDATADADNDGLLNFEEFTNGADPNNPDTDADGIHDGGERTSETGILDPASTPPDADNDGIDDNWEQENCGGDCNPNSDIEDQDGLTEFQEYIYGTDLNNYDTDGDGIADGGEVRASSTDPKNPESKPDDNDGDGMDDSWETRYGLDPLADDSQEDPDEDLLINIDEYNRGENPTEEVGPRDTDGDGMLDDWEDQYGLNKLDPSDAALDNDDDGLTNLLEFRQKTDPNNPDTDGDKFKDGLEIAKGTNPLDPDSFPKSIIPLILFIVGIILALGGGGYLINKQKLEVKLAAPAAVIPTPSAAPRPRPAPRKRLIDQLRAKRLAAQRATYEKKAKQMAEKRTKIFDIFGPKPPPSKKKEEKKGKKPVKKEIKVELEGVKPGEYVELAKLKKAVKKPGVFERVAAITKKPKPKEKKVKVEVKGEKPKEEEFVKLSDIAGVKPGIKEKDEFDKLGDILKKGEAKEKAEFDKLSEVIKLKAEEEKAKPKVVRRPVKKPVKKEKIKKPKAQKVIPKKKPLKAPARKAKPAKKPEEKDIFAEIAEISGKKLKKAGGEAELREAVFDKLSEVMEKEKMGKEAKDIFKDLSEVAAVKEKKTSREELVEQFRRLSETEKVSINVFKVVLSSLLKTGKISKQDVADVMLDLEKNGLVSKEDVAKVLIGMGVEGRK